MDGMNITACLNVATGASEIRRGNGSTPADFQNSRVAENESSIPLRNGDKKMKAWQCSSP